MNIYKPGNNQMLKMEKEQRGWMQRAIIALELIASNIIASSMIYEQETFLATGTSNVFTLTGTPRTGTIKENLFVFVNGGSKKNTDYTLVGQAVTIAGGLIPLNQEVNIHFPL